MRELSIAGLIGRFTLVRFLLVGVFNTLLGLGIIYTLKYAFGVHDAVANLIGYAIGFVASFFLNRQYTFRFRGATIGTFVKFGTVVAAAYLVNLSVVMLAVSSGVDSYLAQALGVLPYTAVTYLGSRHFVFPAPRLQGNHAA